jgi:hypothetical protein
MKLSPIPLSLQQLVEALNKADGRIVRFELPTTTLLSPHVHVTEVARLEEKQIVLSLGMRHTACLAEDVCFPANLQNKSACSPGSGCC